MTGTITRRAALASLAALPVAGVPMSTPAAAVSPNDGQPSDNLLRLIREHEELSAEHEANLDAHDAAWREACPPAPLPSRPTRREVREHVEASEAFKMRFNRLGGLALASQSDLSFLRKMTAEDKVMMFAPQCWADVKAKALFALRECDEPNEERWVILFLQSLAT